jgi:hypothetical protein
MLPQGCIRMGPHLCQQGIVVLRSDSRNGPRRRAGFKRPPLTHLSPIAAHTALGNREPPGDANRRLPSLQRINTSPSQVNTIRAQTSPSSHVLVPVPSGTKCDTQSTTV